MDFFLALKNIKTQEAAIEYLFSVVEPTEPIKKALDFAQKSHVGQLRKSGEPYIVHPIVVSSIVAQYGGDEAMIISALLHDVVEDTPTTIEDTIKMFGEDVGSLVDSLTKIVHIRDEELPPSSSDEKLVVAALSFRKILLASIKDIRALVIKLCDRVHNMLTLDALPLAKQKRISEETLVVYAPIAHRLGISSIKNELEDLSFYYIFPNEYRKIEEYLQSHRQKIHLKLNSFIDEISKLLMKNGFHSEDFRIYSRIKRHYSVYLKMQRKGITIEEVLDLLAIRVVIKDSLDCYKVLGLIHLNFKPIISRFKDYIALPKENGYQTIHTTVFHEASIYEIQIRTTGMHNSAEYGVAAHWKYKSDGIAPNLDWLSNLQFKSTNIEEFYELVKNDLYSEDISVFSPDGDLYTLPNGATALDFGYAIHTDIGNMAKEAYINNIKSSLLTVLKNGDIVRISLSKEIIPRCSWYDAVKTSKAKNAIKLNCIHRMKTIDKESSINILATIFDKSIEEIDHWVKSVKLSNNIHKASRDLNFLREVKNRLKNSYRKDAGFLTKIKIRILKLKSYKFDNIIVSSNTPISSIVFDYCCHPKMGDDIIAFKSGNKAFVHHKMCDIGYEQMVEGTPMLFVEWEKESMVKYNLVVSLDNKKGSLAIFLHFMAKNDINVLKIELGNEKDGYASYCKLNIETVNKDIKILKSLITQKAKVIEMYYEKDAYGGIG